MSSRRGVRTLGAAGELAGGLLGVAGPAQAAEDAVAANVVGVAPGVPEGVPYESQWYPRVALEELPAGQWARVDDSMGKPWPLAVIRQQAGRVWGNW